MIKLVMSDMDGTLLNDKKQLPKDIDSVFEQLLSQGVDCGIATGRSLTSLFRDFSKLKDKLTFIAENGAVVYHKGHYVYKEVLQPEFVKEVIQEAKKIDHIHIVLAALDKTYMLECDETLKTYFNHFYPYIVFVKALEDVSEEIVKISIYDKVGSEKNSYPRLKHLDHKMNITSSGKEWTDVSVKNINKGSGIVALQEAFNITKDECMAFGDYLNDVQMLQKVGYAYAVENAHESIKEICNYRCQSNNDEGVIKTIKEVFGLV